MRSILALLLAFAALAPSAFARSRAIGHRPLPWHAPACTEITGLPWIRFIGSNGELVRSVDPEIVWRQEVLTTEALTIGASGNVLWAVTSDGAIRHSSDAGCTWTIQASVPEALARKSEPLLVTRNPGIVYVAADEKLVRLVFGTVQTFELPEELMELAVHPAEPMRIRGVAIFGAVYDSSDGGAKWTKRSPNFTELASARINPSNFDHIFAGGTRYLSVTTDGGQHWTTPDRIFVDAVTYQIEFSPVDPKVLWIDGYNFGMRQVGLFRSNDGGKTYTVETRYDRVGWVAPSRLAPHPHELLTFAAQNNPGVRVIGAEGQRGFWAYDNFKKALWSPSGTLYYLAQVIESR